MKNLTASLATLEPPTTWAGLTDQTYKKSQTSRPLSTSSTPPSKTFRPDAGQQRAIDLMQGGGNVFLTGMAGTGKSATLIAFIGQAYQRVDVCATTGIAALNLQDQFREKAGMGLPAHTIYRWAGIALGPAPGQSFEHYFAFLSNNMSRSRGNAFRRVQYAECLVIDEVSMLPGRLLDYLDFHFRKIRSSEMPFGGIQMVLVGDFLQLPPVSKTGLYDWAFLSKSWHGGGFRNAYLTNIHRQDEPIFIEALNNFREGRISQAVADVLASRVKMFTDRKIIRLMTHNVQVDKWNEYQIGEIEGPETIFNATFSGAEHETDFLRKNSITPHILKLKAGARVMVTANIINEHSELAAVNGQLGAVTDWNERCVEVALDNGTEIMLEPRKWTFDPQREDSASMEQIPLRPAYAMTIHKSQGLTLDSAVIDIRAAREPGQAYVALSRLKSLAGLYLKEWIKGIHVSPEAIGFYRAL